MSNSISASIDLPTPRGLADALLDLQRYDLPKRVRSKTVINVCLVFSLIVHGMLFVRFDFWGVRGSSPDPAGHSFQVELSRPAPPEPVKPEPKPNPKPKPLPVPEKVITTETPQQQQVVMEEPKEEEEIEVEEPPPPPVSTSPAQKALLTSLKQQYLQTIAAHLEKHKYYPRSARRRHIEGKVRVSFELLENGDIINLQISSGHPTLQKATRKSINNALPLPPIPEQLASLDTIDIEYAMQFSLAN
jgi:protein TonB